MNRDHVEKLVQAVLYEGYILYPYRPNTAKNRQRFTFGRVYPEAYSEAQHGAEPYVIQTQCLVQRGPAEAAPTLTVSVRFLHPMAREAGRLAEPLAALPDDAEPAFDVVPALEIGDRLYQTWQESVEREVTVPVMSVPDLVAAPRHVPVAFAASRTFEALEDDQGQATGVFLRRQHALAGQVALAAEAIDDRTYRVTIRVVNHTPVPEEALDEQDEVVMRTFASTHTIVGVQNGVFLSLMDPPTAYAEAAAACENVGTWPVLVGDEAGDERDTLLSSPIILYDFPKIAAESPGELFDGTEIDEILTLRIMTMTDREKWEMRHVDERARQILQRTESLGAEDFFGMHGTIRSMNPVADLGEPEGGDGHEDIDTWAFPGNNTPRKSVKVGNHRFHTGDRVQIRPKKGGDIMDLALDGKTAVIEAIEQDFENRIYLALVLDDDPGRDMGMLRQPGHRFFFGPDEVEPLGEIP